MITKRIKEVEDLKKSELSEVEQLEQKVDAEIGRGDLDAAITTFTQIMSLRKATLKELKASGGDQEAAKYDTATTLKKFGRTLVRKNDRNNALRAYKDALKLYKQIGMSEEAPEVIEAQTEFENI